MGLLRWIVNRLARTLPKGGEVPLPAWTEPPTTHRSQAPSAYPPWHMEVRDATGALLVRVPVRLTEESPGRMRMVGEADVSASGLASVAYLVWPDGRVFGSCPVIVPRPLDVAWTGQSEFRDEAETEVVPRLGDSPNGLHVDTRLFGEGDTFRVDTVTTYKSAA